MRPQGPREKDAGGRSGASPEASRRYRENATRLRFETFLADLAVRFLTQPSSEIDREIDTALADLTEVLDVDRCSLGLFSADQQELKITYAFARPGLSTLRGMDFGQAFPWYTQQLREGRRVLLNSAVNDLPPEAKEERLYIAESGLRSHVALPLLTSEGSLGALGVGHFAAEREWSAEFLSRLELLASAFAYVLFRRHAEKRIGAAEDLNLSILRSLPSELLVLDGEGRVVALNDAVRHSARRELFPIAAGVDYLSALAAAAESGFSDAPRLIEGIRSVVSGLSTRFETTYTFPAAKKPHHYLLGVTPLAGRAGAIVLHTNVTEMERSRAELEKGLREAEELKQRFEAENVVLQRELARVHGFDTIVGRSAALQRVLDAIDQVAPMESPVLILGETGTGKELVAQLLHQRSRRRQRPLVTVNCAALPPTLIESELFGYERGAFTGAQQRSAGRFEVASGGTLFLDEIAELPPEVQAKLLRVLQSGEFERLGSSHTIRADVRVIAATNRDLQREMRGGRFRADLYYRLSVFPIALPPLRDRPEDVPLLAWHFISRKQGRLGKSVTGIPDHLMKALCTHSWPGNVRELENVIERALILTEGPTLAADPVLLSELGTADTSARSDS